MLRLLLVLLALGGATGQLQAQNPCVIRETVTLGERYNSASHTFTSMSAITAVDVERLRSTSWSKCPAHKYNFSDNRLNTSNGCRADFRVTGLEAGCTVPGTGGSGEIAQSPLFLGAQAEPNVMFLLDDSGSMQFELMPDALTSQGGRAVYYVFPRASGIYGGDDYTNNVPTVDSNDAYNARARSPQVNTIYYNPSITYKPWTRHDGSSYPQASLTCALHNPERLGSTASYCRNLTVDNGRNNNNWVSNNGNSSDNNKTFWPATYFWQTGDASLWSGFTRVEIRSTTATYSGHGRESRTDCADAENGNCTYAEEIQNFANWYTYYRSRILAARGGIGKAFAQQGSGMRVGFGAINKGSTSVDGINTRAIIDGVRRFTGEDRERFFNSLYTHVIPNSGTPLRRALDAAGQYFMRTDNRGPWGETPGTDVAKPHLACRRCYTVLMTDGYWSTGSDNAAGTEDARDNNDGTDGSEIRNDLPQGEDYTYREASPFADDREDTLADVAMYYWKMDLRASTPTRSTGLSNVIGTTNRNPAFWQHMTTYGVGLGVVGAIDPETAFEAIDTGANISWPNPHNSESAKIDDLLHASVNSRGGFFSAADPDTFASELASVLQEIAIEGRSSSSSIAANSTRLDTETLIFQASFNGLDWSGELRAFDLNGNGSVNDEIWSTHTAGLIPAHDARNIFTAVGTQGVRTTTGDNFAWTSLNSEQQGFLSTDAPAAEAATVGAARLNWLRGDRSNEDGETIRLRIREHLLGDIVNSDPFFVGDREDFGYRALPGTEGSSYTTFLTSTKAGRRSMVYVGANDGMLHGFNALTGEEVFGYVPLGVYPNLHELTDPNYQHRYYVDGSPRAGDAYINNAWRTVLLGATGAGGKSVFALNITNPGNMGPSSLMWEFSTAADATDKLGVAMSQPVIARIKAGNRWVAIFGNGYRSDDNVKLFVLDLATGELVEAIDTGMDGALNGLATVVPVDVNNDRITDYVYGGDLEGNLWKFDFTDSSASNWSVSRIFKAEDRDGNAQPITSRPAVGKHPDGGVMVYFGTGKYFETGDGAVVADPQIQSFYGIRDQGDEVERDQLVEQEIIFEDFAVLSPSNELSSTKVRAVSNNSSASAPVAGWFIDLVPPPGNNGQGERVVSMPILRYGRIIFTSIIPSEDPCDFGGTSWLAELDAITGGRLTYSVLDVNNDGRIDDNDFITVNGERIPVSGQHSKEMIKTPGIVGAGEVEYKYTSGSSGTIGVIREKGAGDVLGRQSWRQLQ